MKANAPAKTRRDQRRAVIRRIRTALALASQAVVRSASRFPHALVQGASYLGVLLTLWDSVDAKGEPADGEQEEPDDAG